MELNFDGVSMAIIDESKEDRTGAPKPLTSSGVKNVQTIVTDLSIGQ